MLPESFPYISTFICLFNIGLLSWGTYPCREYFFIVFLIFESGESFPGKKQHHLQGLFGPLKMSWLRIFLQWAVIGLQQVYLPTRCSRLKVRANGRVRRGGKGERRRRNERERDDGRGETEGISREEHTSAERLYALCSPAADACICLLTEVLFRLHRGKGNHHLTKPQLCAVQQLKTDRETGEGVWKCEGESVLGSTADLWGCYAKSSRSNGCHSPVVHLKASTTEDRTNLIADFTSCMGVLVCCDCFFYRYQLWDVLSSSSECFFPPTALRLWMFLKLCQVMQRSSMMLYDENLQLEKSRSFKINAVCSVWGLQTDVGLDTVFPTCFFPTAKGRLCPFQC